ncbi:MAG: TylF/MycF/NovP-related O-methyltransferase [Bacteroidota bacterium]|jgi:O-methyltransferase
MRKFIKKVVNYLGKDVSISNSKSEVETSINQNNFFHSFPDFSEEEQQLIASVQDYTMTSKERLYSLINAIEYIEDAGITGDIVECGVWRGGGMMLVAKLLLKRKSTRKIFLYDTFENGMSKPDICKDVSITGMDAKTIVSNWEKNNKYPTLNEVRQNLFSTGYSSERMNFIEGDIFETLKKSKPDSISLLRLDTDWYSTTKFELEILFPLLSKNGILIIDDYGHWKGARQAVEEYFKEKNIKMYLNRIDYTCRIGIKTF